MIKMYLTFIEKKSFKKFETQNIRKQFKTSENILKMLKYIENVDKTFSQHSMCLRRFVFVFFLFFSTLLTTTGDIFLLIPSHQRTN